MPIAIKPRNDTQSIHEIGAIVNQYTPTRNAFWNTLLNRIALTIVKSKDWDTDFRDFKKGELTIGESIEEIFVNLARPHAFNPDVAEKEVFKREYADVRVAFHKLNYQIFYKNSISEQESRAAFVSWGALSDFVSSIIQSMYTALNYDYYCMVKYAICRAVLNNGVTAVASGSTGNGTESDYKAIVTTAKALANKFSIMSPNYNQSGVYNATRPSDLRIIMTADMDAAFDVNVLASAFNMDKTEFIGHRYLVDSFAQHDMARLAQLFENDANYTPFTASELQTLATIDCVMFDTDWTMIYDVLMEFEDIRNPQGLYYNYCLHKWGIISISPFENAVALIQGYTAPAAPTGTLARFYGATNSATAPTNKKDNLGSWIEFTPTWTSGGSALTGEDAATTWDVSGNENGGTRITDGILRIASNETAASITVTATNVRFGTTVTATVALS